MQKLGTTIVATAQNETGGLYHKTLLLFNVEIFNYVKFWVIIFMYVAATSTNYFNLVVCHKEKFWPKILM